MNRRRFLRSAALVASSTAALPLPAIGAKNAEKCLDTVAPMQDVAGRVAFITGGSSGIGLGIARALAAAGANIALGYRSKVHLGQAMKQLEAFHDHVRAIYVDVADRGSMEHAAEEVIRRFGKIHILVNNAGVNAASTISRTSYEDWDWLMSVNLGGVFNGVHAFLPRIEQHGEGGQIVATSSIAGLYAMSGMGAYCASKFGVTGLMESLREELSGTNIGVSVCCPGVVRTNIDDSARNRPGAMNAPRETGPDTVQDSPYAIDPLEVGQRVLEGIRANDLYILTHAEFASVVAARGEALAASFPTDTDVPSIRQRAGQSVRDRSSYVRERDHRYCRKPARRR